MDKLFSDTFTQELTKLAAERVNATDVKKARMDVALMRKIKRTSGFAAMMGGKVRQHIRKLSLDTIHLARRKEPKITIEQWKKRLSKILSTRRIKVREKIEAELSQRYGKK